MNLIELISAKICTSFIFFFVKCIIIEHFIAGQYESGSTEDKFVDTGAVQTCCLDLNSSAVTNAHEKLLQVKEGTVQHQLQKRVTELKTRKRKRKRTASEPITQDNFVSCPPCKATKTEYAEDAHKDVLNHSFHGRFVTDDAPVPDNTLSPATSALEAERNEDASAAEKLPRPVSSSELDFLIACERRKSSLNHNQATNSREATLHNNPSSSRPKIASAIYVLSAAQGKIAKRRRRACTRRLSWRKWRTRQMPPTLKAMPQVAAYFTPWTFRFYLRVSCCASCLESAIVGPQSTPRSSVLIVCLALTWYFVWLFYEAVRELTGIVR